MEDSVLRFGAKLVVHGCDLVNQELVRGPAVRKSDVFELDLGFGEGDVEDTLAETDALKQELEGQSSLACAGVSFDQIKVAFGEAATEDIVQSGNPGADALKVGYWVSAGCRGLFDLVHYSLSLRWQRLGNSV
jgi:hypothetical protein